MARSTLCSKALGALAATLALSFATLACQPLHGEQGGPRVEKPKRKELEVTGASSVLERVTSEPVDEMHPTVSPDGTVLLFEVRVRDEGSSHVKQQTLVGVDPSTRAKRTLFTSQRSSSNHPAWLPDGSSYVYASDSPGNWSLVRALTSAPNAAVSVIASGEIANGASWPTVSPDGKRVAFVTVVRDAPTLAIIGVDGSRMTLLGEGETPSWSPDGKSLAFVRVVNRNAHLFLLNAETGTDLVQLTTGEFDHVEPTWSPDGRYIAFVTNRGGGSIKRSSNLYYIKRDGTGLTQLTEGETLLRTPHWGRDNWVYFASNRDGNFDVWRLKLSGKMGSLEYAGGAPLPAAPAAPAESPKPASTAATPPTAAPPPPPTSEPGAPPPAGACQKDTDCKGDRICEKGQCVSPPPPATKGPPKKK